MSINFKNDFESMNELKKEELMTMVQKLLWEYVKESKRPSMAGFKVWVEKLLKEL